MDSAWELITTKKYILSDILQETSLSLIFLILRYGAIIRPSSTAGCAYEVFIDKHHLHVVSF